MAVSDNSVRISVCIVCRNEADKLDKCLESVKWADEIVVMDLSSTDGSGDLATRHGARVLTHRPVVIVEMVRNTVAAGASGEWILALDPDERITTGLAKELRQASQRTDIDAVIIPRMNYDFGFPPSSPLQRYEPQLRMYRRSRVKWPCIPNALPEVKESCVYRVPCKDDFVMIHERSRNVPEVLERIVRYAPVQAKSMMEHGEVFTAKAMLTVLFEGIYRHFFLGRAWKDGVPGLLRAGVLVTFKFYVWAAFWQQSSRQRASEDDRLIRRLGILMEGPRLVLKVFQFAANIICKRQNW
jgi:glycosyltransferase involved in cell wall biosynthesis